MKILHVVFSYDADLLTEEELLKRHYTVTGCTEALQRKGVEVCVMNRFAKEIRFQKNNVRYFLFKDRLPGHVKAWHFPLKFLINIRRSDADLVHLHNLTLSLQTLLLRLLIKKNTAIIVQHHGGTSPTGIKRLFHRLLNRVADGYFFATTKQGMEWFNGKYPSHKMMPVMEGATFFNYEDRDDAKEIKCFDRSVARRKTGMSGSPVFLWVGRLDPNKDPLTVLAGFEAIFAEYKGIRLYMIFGGDFLKNEVKEKINRSEVLRERVILLGKVSHEEIEDYYHSSEYFVLGSHDEGSGYALSEAMRCGCVPVITDIPSFRMMTNEGRIGALWEPGNAFSFADAVKTALKKSISQESSSCIEFYKKKLSFDAIAGESIEHYSKVIKARSGGQRFLK